MPKQILYSLEDFDLKDQRVFIRTDFNVPVIKGKELNHIRLERSLPTIRYALEKKAKVIIGSHRGRPDPSDSTSNKKLFSLEPFGYYLGDKLNCEVLFIEDIDKPVPNVLLQSLNSEKIVLLENLRFHFGEEGASSSWADSLASYVDVYINEAFSVSHRSHTSVSLLPQIVKKKTFGFALKEELECLNYVRESAPHPLALLMGGSMKKAEDKIKTISALLHQIDILLLGGAMSYVFLAAQKTQVGAVHIPTKNLSLVTEIIDRLKSKGKKLILPVDHVVVPREVLTSQRSDIHFKEYQKITPSALVPDGYLPVDIGPKTRELFSQVLKEVKTVFWNGPLGLFEEPAFAEGTLAICQTMADMPQTFKVLGGGDSIAAVFQMGYENNFNYISTGGGAALKYLETGSLPGIQSLKSSLSKNNFVSAPSSIYNTDQ